MPQLINGDDIAAFRKPPSGVRCEFCFDGCVAVAYIVRVGFAAVTARGLNGLIDQYLTTGIPLRDGGRGQIGWKNKRIKTTKIKSKPCDTHTHK